MRAPRLSLAALTIALVCLLPTLVFGCAAAGGEPRPAGGSRSLAGPAPEAPTPRRTSLTEVESARALPQKDARGRNIGGLPRYPGSVRVGYQRGTEDGLAVVRARYVAARDPGAVRGFYRDVFRSRTWRVANVEYAGDGWHFLAVSGDREVEVRISPHNLGAKTEVRLSEPFRDQNRVVRRRRRRVEVRNGNRPRGRSGSRRAPPCGRACS